MLSAARVRRTGSPDRAAFARAGAGSRDKRKSKHPEDAFSVQVASGNSIHAFCVLSCWLRGYKKSEQILGRIPCYGHGAGCILGVLRLPLGLPLRGNPSESLRMTEGKNFYRT